MLVSDVLKTKGNTVATIDRNEALSAALGRFSDLPVRALVVVDDSHKMVGMLTIRDALRCVHVSGDGALQQPVESAMSSAVFHVSPDSSLEDVEKLIAEKAVSHVPVLADGKLEGLVTLSDVLQRHLAEAGGLNDDLRRYIHGAYSI